MRDERDERRSRWTRLKTFIGIVIVAFAVTLALVIGNRLSDEALGVLAGAVCGVGAAIPTSLIVVAVVLRLRSGQALRSSPTPLGRSGQALRGASRSQMAGMEGYAPGPNGYPSVIVVSPPAGQPGSHYWNALPPSLSAPVERDFRVVGGGRRSSR